MEKKEWWISQTHKNTSIPSYTPSFGCTCTSGCCRAAFPSLFSLPRRKMESTKNIGLFFFWYFRYSGVPRWQGAKCCQAAIHWYQQIPYLFIIDLDSWGGRRFHHCRGDSPYDDSLHPRHPPPKRPVSFRQFHRVFCASNICTLQWTSDPSFCKVVILTAMKDVLQTRLLQLIRWRLQKRTRLFKWKLQKKINSTKSRLEKGWLFLTTL